jgi:hypothetical protein
MTPIEILQKVQGEIDIAGYKYTAILNETIDDEDPYPFEIVISLDPGVVENPHKPVKKVSIGFLNAASPSGEGFETFRIIDYGGGSWICDYMEADPCTQDYDLDGVIQILMKELAWLAAGNRYKDPLERR